MRLRRDDHGRFAPRVVPRRDELGRFAPRVVPRRDDLGRFTPREVSKTPAKTLAKKPAKTLAKKPAKTLAKKPAKPEAKKLVKKPAKPAAKKLVKKPAKKPAKQPVKKQRRRPERPRVAGISGEAEAEMQRKLLAIQDSLAAIQGGLSMSVQTFINLDGTVDGELRVTELPEEWRKLRGIPFLVSTLSNALRTVIVFDRRPSFGGAFWATFGLRFGPKNQAEIGQMVELYKRHRGLFQIGTYPTPAWGQGALQVAITGDTVGLRAMIQSLMKKRGLPPVEILIRFVWTPDGKRPAHYRGEK